MWVGAAQLTGPISDPENRWAYISPKWLGRTRPNRFFFIFLNFGDRLDPAHQLGWAGQRQVQPKVT